MKNNILKKAAVFSLAMSMLAGCGETAQETAKEPESEMVGTAAATEEAQVQVDAGTLIRLKTGDLYSFRGIPYATAERFKSPEPVTEYENGYQLAFSWGPVSPQARTLSASASPNPYELLTPGNGTADLVGNENCQNLNVWTSDLSSQKPVIVFFHGGGLTSGSSGELSYYTGEYIAQSEDVVFVSVNHRLNVLGFLDLSAYGEEYRNSGIAGLEDCVEALRWVNRNIHAFGGDPDNVTIIGQSGGGDKVTTLACMPETENLFDKAVVMSGYYSDIPQAAGMAETAEMIEKIGLSEDEAAEALTEMPYEELLAASAGMNFDYARVGTGSFTEPFLDETGKMNEYAAKRTWIIGSTYSEFSDNSNIKIYGRQDGYYIDEISDAEVIERLEAMYGENGQAIYDAYSDAYPLHKKAEALFLNTIGANLWGRSWMIEPENGGLKQINDNGVTVYSYVSAYKQPFFGGAVQFHTSDIPYMFNSADEVPYLIAGDEEHAHAMAHWMSSALASFAEDGNPSTDELEWRPYTAEDHATMVFDYESECRADHDAKIYDLIRSAQ